MTNVNPRGQIQLPKALADLGIEVINYFQEQERFDLQLRDRTGGDFDFIDDVISDSAAIVNMISHVFELRQRIGSGIDFTMDTTGFTMDQTEFAMDKSEQ